MLDVSAFFIDNGKDDQLDQRDPEFCYSSKPLHIRVYHAPL